MRLELRHAANIQDRMVYIRMNRITLRGNLTIPEHATGLVVFAHGSGSSRRSPRNRFVSDALNEQGIGTLLIDLLTPQEAEIDRETHDLRFNLPLLAERLACIVDWTSFEPYTRHLKLGLFGASTGAAAALIAAAARPKRVAAIVSRGGRTDLAESILPEVQAPSLLIVGERDPLVLDLNQRALQYLRSPVKLVTVPNATHLFGEPGALEEVAQLARQWFERHLGVDYVPEIHKPSGRRPTIGGRPR